MTKAIVLLSGGLDSTVVLALALAKGRQCHTISFDYQQRHRKELECAQLIAAHYGVSHQVIRIDPSTFAHSALMSDREAPQSRTPEQISSQGIPTTYVPARNTLFLAYALAHCEILQASEIHFGPNRLDAPCYPDCHPHYLEAFQSVINFATKQAMDGHVPKLITPLLYWDKFQIIREGFTLNAPLHLTWSCYCPSDMEKPCQVCDACILREEGFRQVFASLDTNL